VSAPTISAYQRQGVQVVATSADLAQADELMRRHGLSDLLVVDDERGHPVGVISRTDLLRIGRIHARAVARPALLELPHRPVGEVMTRAVVSLPPDAPLADAARLMTAHHIHRVFVGRDDEVTGVFSTREVLHAVIDARVATPLATYMSAPVVTVDVGEALWAAADRLSQGTTRGVVVVENGFPVGLFAQADALAARDEAPDTPVARVMSHALLGLPAELALHRAAALMSETRARRVLAMRDGAIQGVLTGIDFARALVVP
jgi:CBS domain-containing protein